MDKNDYKKTIYVKVKRRQPDQNRSFKVTAMINATLPSETSENVTSSYNTSYNARQNTSITYTTDSGTLSTYSGTHGSVGNTTVFTNTADDNDGTLVIVVSGTVGGAVIILLIVAIYLIVMCHFFKRKKKLSENRRSLSQVYVNQDIIADSVDHKDGIPRNISWKSLQHVNIQENNIYTLAKNEINEKKVSFGAEHEEIPQKHLPNEDNYFILEKVDYVDEDTTDASNNYVNISTKSSGPSDLKRENEYSLRRGTWPSEKGDSKRDKIKGENTRRSEIVDRGHDDDDELDDVYNRLGERSRANSSATANYDSMDNILMNQCKMEQDNIYYNDEDYSDNYNVLKFRSDVSAPDNYNVLNFGPDMSTVIVS